MCENTPFFHDLQMEKYEEVVTITLPGFISQLGGQGGLFVGKSFYNMPQAN